MSSPRGHKAQDNLNGTRNSSLAAERRSSITTRELWISSTYNTCCTTLEAYDLDITQPADQISCQPEPPRNHALSTKPHPDTPQSSRPSASRILPFYNPQYSAWLP
ncbi:hypothetical protein HBI47_074450 [Parastagonospora nodorum]|nr:hypothetical protein HBI47_074450 [Parastagonospora nodorum]